MSLSDILEHTVSKNIEISKEVVLYGAGNFARECLKVLQQYNYEVLYIIDEKRYQENISIESIPIISLYDVRLKASIKETCSCVLAVFNAYVDLSKLEIDIKEAGLSNIINPLEFVDKFYGDMGDQFWLTSTNTLKEYKSNIINTYNKLADYDSKKLYKSLIEYRVTKKLNIIKVPQCTEIPYIPKDINVKYPKLNFIDCGAYDGDTITKFIQHGMQIESYIAFEPDIVNIKKLSQNIKLLPGIKGLIYPCGVYSSSTQLRFSGEQGSASHIDEKGDTFIQVVSMDEILVNYDINFIKMDIEGAEIEALKGAKKLIQKNRPFLAISAYHRFDDVWTIIELISEWKLDYIFYLRIDEYNGFGLVYYAIPKSFLIEEEGIKYEK